MLLVDKLAIVYTGGLNTVAVAVVTLVQKDLLLLALGTRVTHSAQKPQPNQASWNARLEAIDCSHTSSSQQQPLQDPTGSMVAIQNTLLLQDTSA
jgi:hypothetical protein